MRIYLAVTSCHYTGYDMMKGCDILSSYFYCKNIPELTAIIPETRDFMLDSGVFSFINSGKKVDYDRYIHEYADYIKENNIRAYVELDVDYSRTWSCYKGGEKHCGKCGTCVERKEAFALAGVPDPTEYEE